MSESDAPSLQTHIKEAQSLVKRGCLAEAEVLWRSVLCEDPASRAAATGLVKLLDARGERAEAEAVLRRLIAHAPTHAHILAAARQWEAWERTPRPLAPTVRIALTGTGTLDLLVAHLRVACAQLGLHPSLYNSPFNQWAQDLIPPDSAFYKFAPELIIILLDAAAVFPHTVEDADATFAETTAEREAGLAQIGELLRAAARNAPGATILLHTFAPPDYPSHGILDALSADGQAARFRSLNEHLARIVRQDHPGVYLVDQERLEARHGKDRIRDDRLWFLASMPFSETFLPILTAEYIRFICPLKGLTRKAIILDLDNTLWGGVVGEDDAAGIKLGGTVAPGNAFHDFQKALDRLRKRGILLAICSKNNAEDVWPVLDDHPSMLLRRDSFAAVRINWQDKATNILEIAHELNIGLDSLVFLDDNPAERALVRQELPEVLTVELPRDPALYTRTVYGLDVFETLTLSAEDQRRGQLYAEQQQREQFKRTISGDMPSYLADLQMVVQLSLATPFTIPRIAQLINKTNQFNLTARRYTEAQVASLSASPDWEVYSVTMRDRFGDSGLIGAALVRTAPDIWEIDSFLLSCRVLGRGVEDALLTYIVGRARDAGAHRLRGFFISTAKNTPAASFYSERGFGPVHTEREDQNMQVWDLHLEVARSIRSYPGWLSIEKEPPASLL